MEFISLFQSASAVKGREGEACVVLSNGRTESSVGLYEGKSLGECGEDVAVDNCKTKNAKETDSISNASVITEESSGDYHSPENFTSDNQGTQDLESDGSSSVIILSDDTDEASSSSPVQLVSRFLSLYCCFLKLMSIKAVTGFVIFFY